MNGNLFLVPLDSRGEWYREASRSRPQPEFAQTHVYVLALLASCVDPGWLRELLARTERSLQPTAPRRSASGSPSDPDLSERELAVLGLLASDLSQREIGAELYISLNTVKFHIRNIFRKLGVSSRAEAVARRRGLAPL